MVASERSKYYLNTPILYWNTNELPYFQDSGGKKINTDMCLFFNTEPAITGTFRYTVDSPAEMENDIRCWSNDMPSGYYKRLTSTYRFAKTLKTANNSIYSLYFGRPQKVYNESDKQITGTQPMTIYERFWQKYLSDICNLNTRIIKIRILLNENIIKNIFRGFVIINNTVWVVNEISGFDVTKYETFADVTLTSVNSPSNYTSGQTI
jgi:hypothetical protein